MSRRSGISPADDGRWVFNRLAAAYRSRPGYPEALVDRLRQLAGAGARVADLGAGTGHLALPLAARGLRVAAVEPARAMLAELSRAAGPRVEAVHATAERTGLPDAAFQLVVVADALQWIDPEHGAAEARRLLAPGGALAVVTVRLSETPFLRALGARIAARNPKARPGPPPVALYFSLAGLSVPAEEVFADRVELDPPALEGILRSLSFVGPALGPHALEALLAEARKLAAEHGGAVWERELRLAWARRPDPGVRRSHDLAGVSRPLGAETSSHAISGCGGWPWRSGTGFGAYAVRASVAHASLRQIPASSRSPVECVSPGSPLAVSRPLSYSRTPRRTSRA